MNLSIRAAIDHVPVWSMSERARPLGGRWGECLDRQINMRRRTADEPPQLDQVAIDRVIHHMFRPGLLAVERHGSVPASGAPVAAVKSACLTGSVPAHHNSWMCPSIPR